MQLLKKRVSEYHLSPEEGGISRSPLINGAVQRSGHRGSASVQLRVYRREDNRTEVRLVGAALQPHALLCTLDQKVAHQLIGQIPSC